MENKELIIKAIEAYDLLSINKKKVIKALMNYDCPSTAEDIMKFTGFSKPIAYTNINSLITEKFLTKEKKRVFVYTLNKNRLLELAEQYRKKLEVIKNSTIN